MHQRLGWRQAQSRDCPNRLGDTVRTKSWEFVRQNLLESARKLCGRRVPKFCKTVQHVGKGFVQKVWHGNAGSLFQANPQTLGQRNIVVLTFVAAPSVSRNCSGQVGLAEFLDAAVHGTVDVGPRLRFCQLAADCSGGCHGAVDRVGRKSSIFPEGVVLWLNPA